MNIQLQQAFEGAYKLPLFEQNILADALMATIRNYCLLMMKHNGMSYFKVKLPSNG